MIYPRRGGEMKIGFESLQNSYKRCIDERRFYEMVAECAYFKAEKRGFAEGLVLQDWLEAEEEVGRRCFYWFQEG